MAPGGGDTGLDVTGLDGTGPGVSRLDVIGPAEAPEDDDERFLRDVPPHHGT